MGRHLTAMLGTLVAVGVLLAGCANPPAPGFGAPTPIAPTTGNPGSIIDTASTSSEAVSSSTPRPTSATLSAGIPAATDDSSATAAPTAAAPAATSPTAAASTTSATRGKRPFGTVADPIAVQVTGLVLADTKGKSVMCPPFPVSGVGTVSGGPTPTPDCLDPVPVSGVDLDHLQSPGHNTTHRWGNTHIQATWNGSALTVRSQRDPQPKDQDPLPNGVDHLTCATPARGWALGPTQNDQGIAKIEAAVGADFGGLSMGYPHGGPANVDGNNPSYELTQTEQVVVVGVTGNIAVATKAIRTVFQGNLCVVHASATKAVTDHQAATILAALGPDMTKSGVITVATGQPILGTQTNEIQAVVDTAKLEQLVAGLAGPPVTISPWIKPSA